MVCAVFAIWAFGSSVSMETAVEELARAGVPSVACRNHGMLRFHPQFVARGFFEEVDHPAVGTHLMPAQPYRMRGIERWFRTPTPMLGEHNREVLGELGLDPDEISALEDSGEIGNSPVF